jgi:hypothetical protein
MRMTPTEDHSRVYTNSSYVMASISHAETAATRISGISRSYAATVCNNHYRSARPADESQGQLPRIFNQRG